MGEDETSGQDHARDSGARRVLSFLGDSSDPDGVRKQPSTWSIVWTDNACWQQLKRLRGGATLKLELQHARITYRVRIAFQRGSRTPRFDEGTRIPCWWTR